MIKRIYYHDTDCGGVVYYANYLKYFEEARTEYFRDKGIDLIKDLSAEGFIFVVRAAEIDYKAPARYGDIINICTQIAMIKKVSIEFYQEIKKEDALLVCAKIRLVFVNKDFYPASLPSKVLTLLTNEK